jgi:peptidoglycan/LPS O-acetylase OafA/YrhL
MKNKIYFENLDTLRWFCFLGVFFFHAFHTELPEIEKTNEWLWAKHILFANGNLGVHVFFVLSGFLITFLLAEEVKENGHFNILLFWQRRILRIWPVYFACVFFGFVIFPFAKKYFLGAESTETANWWAYLLFLSNFDMIKNGLPDSSALSILWSISVEEQFYILQPLLLYKLRLRHFWIPFVFIILFSFFYRLKAGMPTPVDFHSISCFGDLCIGSLGAWFWHQNALFRAWIRKMTRIEIVLLYLLLFYFVIFREEFYKGSVLTAVSERVIFSFLALLLILEQNFAEKSFFKFGKIPHFGAAGRITYGLYCYHIIALLVIQNIGKFLHFEKSLFFVIYAAPFFGLLLSLLMAFVSFRFYEKPFLKLKKTN